MMKSVRMALLAAIVTTSFMGVSYAREESTGPEAWWGASGYAYPGKGMRTMKMMHMMDTNNDSKVTKEEFMHFYEMVWEKMDPKHLGEVGVNKWIAQ